MAYRAQSVNERSQDMNLEAGTAQRAQSDAAYWLNSRLTFRYLSYTARAHLPRDGATNIRLGPPISN